MATATQGLRPRQLKFNFDYKAEELTDVKKPLEDQAKAHELHEENSRVAEMNAALVDAKLYHDDREIFQENKKPTDSWAAWTKGRLGRSASHANKKCQIFEVFGRYIDKPEAIAGIPPSRLYKLSMDKAKSKRASIIKKAKTHEFEPADIDALIDDKQATEEVSFSVTKPTDHDELRAYIEKDLAKLEKKVDEDLAEEIPDVLQEIAESWHAEPAE